MAITTRTSRLGTAENLPNSSTYDVLLVSTDSGYPTGQISFGFEVAPRKITGIQKVAQLFIKILLTQKGSDVIQWNIGTNFPELAIGANRQTKNESFMADIITCVKDAEGQVKALTASRNKDLESQLNKIVLQSIDVSGESLTMYLQLITRAGTTASIAIPFPELDMKIANQ